MSICKTAIGGSDYPLMMKEAGLTNAYQVSTDIEMCVDSVERVDYTLSGTCKLVTGLTISSPCVYNLSEVDDFDITFDFNDPSFFTGYTGTFHYFGYDTLDNNSVSFYGNELHSNITGSTLTRKIFSNDLSQVDTSIYVKSRDVYNSQCSNTVVNGYALDTPSAGFDDDYDWYMVTLVNPVTPTLGVPTSDLSSDNVNLINERLTETTTTNVYTISAIPNGGISLYINGVLVSPRDYSTNNQVVTISGTITTDENDIVTAIYIAGDKLTNSVFDELLVTGITSGATSSASSVNEVFFNTTNSRYEYFLTNTPISTTNIQLFLDGVQLVNGEEFFLSNSIPNKVIFAVGLDILVGDTLLAYYLIPEENLQGNIGSVITTTPTLSWNVNDSYSDGIFTLEVVDIVNSGYTSILYSATTIYDENIYSYSVEVGPVSVDDEFRFRVRSEKNFTDIKGNVFVTESISDDGFFDTKDPNLVNTSP